MPRGHDARDDNETTDTETMPEMIILGMMLP